MPRVKLALVQAAVISFTVLPPFVLTATAAERPEVIYTDKILLNAPQVSAQNTPQGMQKPVPAKANNILQIKEGRSEILKPGRLVQTIIIGNDLVADASTEQGLVVLTGKLPGLTNLILLDDAANEIFSATVEVIPVNQPPQTVEVRVVKGVEESKYSCGVGPQFCDAVEGDVANAGGASVTGACLNPDDLAADGTRCGDRASSVKPEVTEVPEPPESS